MQVSPQPLTEIPPKPTCNPNNIFNGTDCQDRINIYNQAVQKRQAEELQLYVNRQKELATSQAVAPLQAQIADLTKQVGTLHEQMKQQTAASVVGQSNAHAQGMMQGAGIGVVGSLILYGIVRFARGFTIQPKSRAASV